MRNEKGATGRCLCGHVRFRITGKLRDAVACHCTQCRKTSGHHAAFSACRKDDLILENSDTLRWYESSPGVRRGFCSRCGASLLWEDSSRDYIAVAAGSLDKPTGIRLTKHIYVADKGDYYRIEGYAPADIHPSGMESLEKINPDPE